MVLSPLASVTDHAQRIAAADDLSARLAYQRRARNAGQRLRQHGRAPGQTWPDRRRDLQQFLRLSVAELKRSRTVASERLRDIIEQAGLIQGVLAEQQQHQRSGPVLLPMTPAELVSLSLQQVAPAHLQRLELDISPGIAALGSLSLPCTNPGGWSCKT